MSKNQTEFHNFPTKNGKRTDLIYNYEPERINKELIVRNKEPFNAEPPLKQLVGSYVTPKEVFFKRNHGPIPLIDENKHFISIEGIVPKPLNISVKEIKSDYKKHTILAALQCAGNRRDGLLKVKPVKGVIWGPGTIANSYWAGARLRDILLDAGIPEDVSQFEYPDAHVWMEAVGGVEEDRCYGSSIPLKWAMNIDNDVLLAYEMNNELLPRDHGYPIRMVVPGVIGARSVKYLNKIIIQNEESPSFFQRRDYKILPQDVEEKDAFKYWDKSQSIHEMNVQSVICTPSNQSKLEVSCNEVKGYAISGGGRKVTRVEVTFDEGKSWELASLKQEKVGNGYWSWCLWSLKVKSINPNTTIMCRAWDSASNTQPELPIWNFRGVMNNCWDKVDSLSPEWPKSNI
ncbi:sulfite oxidase-like protein [Neoconidiobolus thromboides FSU 785]|nr:sulfite oxidase-like protein [Neoconidiobolus thromboides FSU 785]